MNKEVLATVAGEEITTADLEAFLQNVPQEQRKYAANPQFRESYLERLLVYRSYAKLGEELKLDETEEFKVIFENAKREILAQMAISETLKAVSVTQEEIEDYYGQNAQRFMTEETVSAKHILVDNEEKCKEVLELVTNGTKTFEEAAEEFSTCPSKQRGGDLGEFGKGQMVKEFEEASFAAEIGVVVGPVKTQFGYHLIKVEEKNEAAIILLEEVEDQIRKTLMQQKQNQLYTEKAEELKAKYVKR